MRVLHISTSDTGGAGLAALRLHMALLEQGVDSKMLVAEKSSDMDSVFQAERASLNSYVPPRNKVRRKIEKILRRRGKCLSRLERYDYFIKSLHLQQPPFFTYPVSCYDISGHPLVKESDIIHLHWIQDFVDFETFFSKVDKPVVWTFHDLNPLYGGFHHYRKRQEFYELYKPLEDEFVDIKRKAMAGRGDVSVVALSSEMKRLISESDIYKGKPIFEAHNVVDYKVFTVHERARVRQMLNLSEGKRVILFSNNSLNDTEKGLDELCQALEELQLENVMLLLVGEGKVPSVEGMEVKRFHRVADMEWLSMLYSCADLLVFPSKQECFPQTPLEAMACGTPVVMTPVSGSAEQILPCNGVIASDFSVEALKEAIAAALSITYNPDEIRKSVVERFAPEKIAKQYESIYRQMNSDLSY